MALVRARRLAGSFPWEPAIFFAGRQSHAERGANAIGPALAYGYAESSNFLQNAGISRSEWKNLPVWTGRYCRVMGKYFPVCGALGLMRAA